MDIKILIIVSILIVVAVFSILLSQTLKLNPFFNIEKGCSSNSDCSWRITNCCPENSGAKWDCVGRNYEEVKCPSSVICPQVISPKPKSSCICKNGGCSEK